MPVEHCWAPVEHCCVGLRVVDKHVVIIGGGIIGLATAAEFVTRGHRVTVLEKETRWAAHQSGHNSNVVHSGVYYTPGSAKARMATAGNAAVVAFAREHGVNVDVCGKLVVATSTAELPRLRLLAERAEATGVRARMLGPAAAAEHEPHVSCVAALWVASTGIIDYPAVCEALADRLHERGAQLRLGTVARAIRRSRLGHVEIVTGDDTVRADLLINCAGLHADRVAELAGVRPTARIVPFRGEYFTLRPERAHLVRGLIYPVPDPALPFLGGHLTRMLDGSVHAGPNAVLALSRDGYRGSDISVPELAAVATFPGAWRLARRYASPTGLHEVIRSVSKRRFAASLARLVPAVTEADIIRHDSGVR